MMTESRDLGSKWPHLNKYFEQLPVDNSDLNGNFMFKCILCLPKTKLLSTSKTSNSNLKTHIKVSFKWYRNINKN